MIRGRVDRTVFWLLALITSGLVLITERAWANLTLATPLRAPHPEPRVIVTVTAMNGPHDRAAVQRAARETWGGIVRCYKALGERKQGTLELELEISERGKVMDVRRVDSRDSALNGQLSDCLVQVLRKKTMPTAPTSSIAALQIQVAPGND